MTLYSQLGDWADIGASNLGTDIDQVFDYTKLHCGFPLHAPAISDWLLWFEQHLVETEVASSSHSSVIVAAADLVASVEADMEIASEIDGDAVKIVAAGPFVVVAEAGEEGL